MRIIKGFAEVTGHRGKVQLKSCFDCGVKTASLFAGLTARTDGTHPRVDELLRPHRKEPVPAGNITTPYPP